jgi:hypothetical protein
MTLFVIIPTDPDPIEIEAEIAKLLPNDSYRLPQGEWVVRYSGTTQELSNALLITDGSSENAVIFAISAYFGRAPTNIWEWVKTRWG